MKKLLLPVLFFGIMLTGTAQVRPLKVSGRFLATDDNKPFFWLGDTAWLLFGKLNREEAEQYLEDRRQKGFNVIQIMVLHTLGAKNAYGDSALVNKNVATPLVTGGADPGNAAAYDYWDHVDYVADRAAAKGLYLALVPVWGSNVKAGHVSPARAEAYTRFLTERYGKRPNIIWLNGGDIKGSDSLAVWQTIGRTLRQTDPHHLITFHPRGRTTSSEWFHTENWLDFNMFQSGHRTYEQDTTASERWHFGEDNWKFAEHDYSLKPAKPTIDGEPSYEQIPHGLHDPKQPRWQAADVRRYGYWSVFAGAFGYTYGHNSIMQMHRQTARQSSYGALDSWQQALNAEGARQMVYLKKLLESRSFFDRVPDQSLVANSGNRYAYLPACRGAAYVLVYTYTGRTIEFNAGKTGWKKLKAYWYSPKNGKQTTIGTFDAKPVLSFDPPGIPAPGNDWVLIVEKG